MNYRVFHSDDEPQTVARTEAARFADPEDLRGWYWATDVEVCGPYADEREAELSAGLWAWRTVEA